MADDDEPDDAARAFEDLTAEVRVMRRAVEALEARKPVDYAPTLAALAQELERFNSVTTTLANRPRQTPEAYAAEMRRAVDQAVRPIAAELQRAQALAGQIERAAGAIGTREEQRARLSRAAIGGVAAAVFLGALLLLPIVRMLPASWHVPERLAAGIVGDDRWAAGERMMASHAPEAWERIASAAELDVANREALDACRMDAARTRRVQRCIIKIDPPDRPTPTPKAGEARKSDR